MPHKRSGHSCVVHGEKMYIFGGIFELMKESNDMVIFNLRTRKFTLTEHGAHEPNSPDKSKYAADQQSTHDMSPTKLDRSPNKRRTTALYNVYSPTKGGSPLKKRQLSPSKTMTEGDVKEDKKRDNLSSPTSISMKDSFIIKNADTSFDAYYKSMQKRKHAGNFSNTYGHETTQQTH